jgi:hypothetical protein
MLFIQSLAERRATSTLSYGVGSLPFIHCRLVLIRIRSEYMLAELVRVVYQRFGSAVWK